MMLSMLGMRMLPLHLSMLPARLDIWSMGRASENIRKYIDASAAMSAPPPSQKGSREWMAMAVSMSVVLKMRVHTMPCRNTRRARSKLPAPKQWATWTEKPMEAALSSPPKSHVVDSTRPMDADCRAPRLPTMAASMKNISTDDSWASIDGILISMMRRSFSRLVIARPSRMYASSFPLLSFPDFNSLYF